jgi:hypothetical protein
MPYESILELAQEQFNQTVSVASISNFIRDLALRYSTTEKMSIQRLLDSPFIHADETPVNIRGVNQYTWVFTNGVHTVFRLTHTRESTVVHEILTGYKGVLISDFYPGYDSISCTQQKCWVHLIRDLNSDLLQSPFDTEYETFVSEIRDLIVPIMETIQTYGLRKRNLNKFVCQVEAFYERVIIKKRYKSELVQKYQDRFMRYEHSLFTFLRQEGIPWHNNTAEQAIRHLCVQEKISGCFHESLMPDYLLLLGIAQTCRMQEKSFFQFLFSGEQDLDSFKRYKR